MQNFFFFLGGGGGGGSQTKYIMGNWKIENLINFWPKYPVNFIPNFYA